MFILQTVITEVKGMCVIQIDTIYMLNIAKTQALQIKLVLNEYFKIKKLNDKSFDV